ncbi:MAG: hypothetical protein MUP97_12010 [Acidimicrobiia bacterium]|jgi:hypothetical protein|nr:hypothetical protein [Acidimicrobiia bacterium]
MSTPELQIAEGRAAAPDLFEIADASPEALFEAYASQGWGDGLPLVAPTPERVEAMLAHTDGDPDEILGVLPPRFGKATRRLVAVNAVLAGCPPDVMPVLVSAVRGLARPELNLRGVNATTHPVAPLLVVHGAIAEECGFNGGIGAFGPGNRANATVGRAVRLILLHIAGARPGDGDASQDGQPSKYSYCVAENLAASPWEAYARARGVEAPSAVTLHCGENPHNVHDMESSEPAPILDKVATAMASFGQNNAPIAQGEYFVLLGPEHAATIAAAGWGRRDVSLYLYERARFPAGQFRAAFTSRAWMPWMEGVADDQLLPMTGHPDNIRVMVVGGAGKHSMIVPSWGMTTSVTLPVEP